MAFLTLGVVSNVWAALLPETSIEALCAAAAADGYGYVELRQRALGNCEAARPGGAAPLPLPERLGELARNVPGLALTLAVEAPLTSRDVPVDEAAFAAAVAGARALGGDPPMLR